VGVTRHEDAILVGDRRRADAELGQAATRGAFLDRLEAAIGTPDQSGSLAARTAAFEAALAAAAAAPHQPARLGAAVTAAVSLADTVNGLSADVQAGAVATVQGSALNVAIDGSTVRVDDATVIATDIVAANGVIHVIDSVVIPR